MVSNKMSKNVETCPDKLNQTENDVNFATVREGLQSVSNPEILVKRIQGAFDTFETQTGRQMTYSEMREMMG
jgi:hypothetical protein